MNPSPASLATLPYEDIPTDSDTEQEEDKHEQEPQTSPIRPPPSPEPSQDQESSDDSPVVSFDTVLSLGLHFDLLE